MNKKLIYILNHFSVNSGQHYFHVINLLKEIASLGVQITLIIEKCEELPELAHPNITIIPQQSKHSFGRVIELFRVLNKLGENGYHKVFVRISWVAACISIMVGFVKKLETYYWLSGQGSLEQFQNLPLGKEKLKLFFKDRIPFWFIKTFAFRFATGPESMCKYMHEVMKVPPKKIMLLYNDIDISRFSRATRIEKSENKKKLNLPAEKKIILFVHRLSPVRKTLFYLPYIVTEFYKKLSTDDYYFVFVGSGPEECELKKAIMDANLGDYIAMFGTIPNHQIDVLYKSADIFINPTFAEGFPRVILEAMASGLPIVTTNAGGINDLLGYEQKNMMVDREDRVSFANKLIELSIQKELQQNLSDENLSQVQLFSTKTVAKMYIAKIFA